MRKCDEVQGARTQDHAPLAEALARYAAARTIRLHTPGHAGGQGWNEDWQRDFSTAGAWDVTELTDLADGHSTEYWVGAAQELAAEAFGAKATFFLTGGSSLGIHTVLTACAGPGDEVLLPRNAHQSVIHGLALCGATPRFIAVPCSPDGIPGTVTPAALKATLDAAVRPRLVLLLSPSYQGFCPDLAALIEIAHQAGVPVFVDEAHGAHFPFHSAFPPSAGRCGADAWVQSAHKTLGALTGSALLHIGNGAFTPEVIRRSLLIHSSTSPSYLLMASIDESRRIMSLEGQKLWDHAIRCARRLRETIGAMAGVRLADLAEMQGYGAKAQDPTRIVFGVQGLSGTQIEAALRRRNITAEYADDCHVCLIIPYSITDAQVQTIIGAIAELAEEVGNRDVTAEQASRCGNRSSRCSRDRSCSSSCNRNQSCSRSSSRNHQPLLLPPPPRMAITLREALIAPFEEVALAAAVGRIAAATVAFYPPGIPLAVPGEEITAEIIEYIQKMSSQTGIFPGPASQGKIWVVSESAVKADE